MIVIFLCNKVIMWFLCLINFFFFLVIGWLLDVFFILSIGWLLIIINIFFILYIKYEFYVIDELIDGIYDVVKFS